MEQVTALIKTFLRDEYLFNCVKTLKQHAPAIHIAVADDGHTSDDKEKRLLSMGVDRYIRLPFNSAPVARGRNLLVNVTETPYVLIGDDDFTYTGQARLPDLLSMMSVADIAGGAIMERGQILHYEGRFYRVSSEAMKMMALSNGPYCQHESVMYQPADYVYNFFIAKTTALKKVHWDERLRASYEHEDFFLTAKKAGYKVAYCPNSLAHHRYGPPDSTEYQRYRHSGDRRDKTIFEKKWRFRL